MICHQSMTLVIKSNIIWKYLMTNVMRFPYLYMTNSAFSIAQDKDNKSHFYTLVLVQYKKLPWIKYKIINERYFNLELKVLNILKWDLYFFKNTTIALCFACFRCYRVFCWCYVGVPLFHHCSGVFRCFCCCSMFHCSVFRCSWFYSMPKYF